MKILLEQTADDPSAAKLITFDEVIAALALNHL
jgi:hypothetical protein